MKINHTSRLFCLKILYIYEVARGAFYPTHRAHSIDTNTLAKIMFCLIKLILVQNHFSKVFTIFCLF